MRQGKIRYFGVSNHRSWRIAEICAIADRMGIEKNRADIARGALLHDIGKLGVPDAILLKAEVGS